MVTPKALRENVPLAPMTTLGLGGDARYFLPAGDDRTLIEGLRWADGRGLPAVMVGGGSNLVVADGGFPGLAIHVESRGLHTTRQADAVLIDAAAGEAWDSVVAGAVAQNLSGIECLSGIPGLVGATPIQNVGAYGQEVADTIVSVRVYDRRDDQVRDLNPDQCEFSYRDSVFRRNPERFAVLSVCFRLTAGGVPVIRHGELQARLAQDATSDDPVSLMRVRDTVLQLRRAKSMVIDPHDENRRSVGSFFTNPIVSLYEAQAVVARALAAGLAATANDVPQYPAGEGRVKLAAGWLIEKAGITRGMRVGNVGVSSRHALCLVHHGGGSTAALLALARQVQGAVQTCFGVTLNPEPILLGAVL